MNCSDYITIFFELKLHNILLYKKQNKDNNLNARGYNLCYFFNTKGDNLYLFPNTLMTPREITFTLFSNTKGDSVKEIIFATFLKLREIIFTYFLTSREITFTYFLNQGR